MGVCVTPDEQLWNNSNFMSVIIFDAEGTAQGGMHLLVIEDEGEKYLTLPGINPSIALLGQAEAAQLYEEMIIYAKEAAQKLGCKEVLLPQNKEIYSNRGQIHEVVEAKGLEPHELSKAHEFSYDPYEYDFRNCYKA